MARRNRGIKFYGMDSDHVQNKKIKLLVNEFDSHGYWVYQCILCTIYYQKGYFMDMSNSDELILFASDVCKKPVSLVKEVIQGCIRRGLFDKSVYDMFNVLTSDRIQENYLIATYESRKKGAEVQIINEYWLLKNGDFNDKGITKISIKNDGFLEKDNNSREDQNFSRENEENSSENTSQRKGKEKKGEERKGKERESSNKFSPPSMEDVLQFFIEKIPESGWAEFVCDTEAKKFINHYDSKNWYVGKNKMSKWKSSAAGWILRKNEFDNGNKNQQNNAVIRPNKTDGRKDFGKL